MVDYPPLDGRSNSDWSGSQGFRNHRLIIPVIRGSSTQRCARNLASTILALASSCRLNYPFRSSVEFIRREWAVLSASSLRFVADRPIPPIASAAALPRCKPTGNLVAECMTATRPHHVDDLAAFRTPLRLDRKMPGTVTRKKAFGFLLEDGILSIVAKAGIGIHSQFKVVSQPETDA